MVELLFFHLFDANLNQIQFIHKPHLKTTVVGQSVVHKTVSKMDQTQGIIKTDKNRKLELKDMKYNL